MARTVQLGSPSRQVLSQQGKLASMVAYAQSRSAAFSVAYWGGADKGWDLESDSRTPWICRHCDAMVDVDRGRFESAQVSLRMCAGEGRGFKRYVRDFLMLSAKASVEMNLQGFYNWSVSRKTKVLTERLVLGSILDVHTRRLPPGESGLQVENAQGVWQKMLHRLAWQLQLEAHAANGLFGAVLLDNEGTELRLTEMLELQGRLRIERLLIVVAGPDGIPNSVVKELQGVLGDVTDFPLLRCCVPGGAEHSYALAAMFILHDQGVLLPFLSYLAEHPTDAVGRPAAQREGGGAEGSRSESGRRRRPEGRPRSSPPPARAAASPARGAPARSRSRGSGASAERHSSEGRSCSRYQPEMSSPAGAGSPARASVGRSGSRRSGASSRHSSEGRSCSRYQPEMGSPAGAESPAHGSAGRSGSRRSGASSRHSSEGRSRSRYQPELGSPAGAGSPARASVERSGSRRSGASSRHSSEERSRSRFQPGVGSPADEGQPAESAASRSRSRSRSRSQRSGASCRPEGRSCSRSPSGSRASAEPAAASRSRSAPARGRRKAAAPTQGRRARNALAPQPWSRRRGK